MNLVAAAKVRCFDSKGVTPIFMFHRINRLPAGANWPQLYVAPKTFSTEIGKLKRAGVACLRLDEVRDPSPSRNKGFVLTFDDGFVSALERAGPCLAGLGLRAINFLVAGRLGMRNEWDAGVDNTMEPLMDDSQVRDWLSLGHDIGGHTVTHPHLDQIPLAQAREEIFAGKKKLEDTFGREVRHFAYPYGGLTPAVVDAVREAGFSTACTTVTDLAGSDTLPLTLPRLNVDRDLLDAAKLAAKALSRARQRFWK
ncbi:MAG: polysaccharide deacetylase family protein [Verrucomicrobia bacterium]|nr:polysaccharide deacetylase family protein [Verrucomicrobiota bacterium]